MALKQFVFNVLTNDKIARLGLIETHRGNIDTPAFMPVVTQGTVKGAFINDVIKTDMPITLNDVAFEDSWAGDMDSRRRIEWTLTFTAKTYLYGPAQEQKIIKNVVTQFYEHTDPQTVDALTSPRGTVTNATGRYEYDSDEDLTITINSNLG